jgi:hypothetical protein
LTKGHGYPLEFEDCFGIRISYYALPDLLQRIDFEANVLDLKNSYCAMLSLESYKPTRFLPKRSQNCFPLDHPIKLEPNEKTNISVGKIKLLNSIIGSLKAKPESTILVSAAISLEITPSVLVTTDIAKAIMSNSASNEPTTFFCEESTAWSGETYESNVTLN